MEWINLPFVQGGALVVVLGVIWLMIIGKILPKSHVDALREGDKMTIARQQEEIKEWRTAWIAADLAKRELASQVGELTETGRVTVELLRQVAGGKGS